MYKVLIATGTLMLVSPVLAGGLVSGSDGTDLALDCAALMALAR